MRAYRVEFRGKTRYAATQAEARQAKQAVQEAAGIPALSREAKSEECDIPTDKAGLLDFINGLCARADPKEA